MALTGRKSPLGLNLRRKDDRIIIHFDYDCFYASVFEVENPALKALPLAVQQKQIIVTCNYEARRRGLQKLQLISEAKKICPDVVILLGEELGRFRDASKALFKFLEAFSWSGKVERLGFDEVFMDVTDIIDYNQALLNSNDLPHSFFQLSRDDPTIGFPFDATEITGHGYPHTPSKRVLPLIPSRAIPTAESTDVLETRLILGSHLAQRLRLSLEEETGYTSTVGISTNKLLSKLVGKLNKPKGQTTLLPPYILPGSDDVTGEFSAKISHNDPCRESNITKFIDGHDIGEIPGIGSKMSQKIRNHVLLRPANFDHGLIYGGTKESVTVRHVRLFPAMGPDTLEKVLGGAGAERGIGGRAWALINGVDDTEVKDARKIPSQISIEDSYTGLDNIIQVAKEFRMLATSLIKRMHTDLLEGGEDDKSGTRHKRFIAHPRTIRLSTRPRPPLNADGIRTRSFNRISKSGPLPNFVFNLREETESIVEKLVQQTLIPMFRRLHPQQGGWNVSLLNIGVTNMVEAASEDGSGGGRDIGQMFKRQEDVLREWKVEDEDVSPQELLIDKVRFMDGPDYAGEPGAGDEATTNTTAGSEGIIYLSQSVDEHGDWGEEDNDGQGYEKCLECGAVLPPFATAAHARFHSLEV